MVRPFRDTVKRPLEALFDGWWVLESQDRCPRHYTYKIAAVQVHTGDPIDIESHRGPWPTEEMAWEFARWDQFADYRDSGMAVYAKHCLGCGRWAHAVSGNDQGNWSWYITECSRCGVLDSREICYRGNCGGR